MTVTPPSRAYFINSYTGTVYPVPVCHLASLAEHPDELMVSQEEVARIFEENGEEYSIHAGGAAWDEIMRLAASRGILRVREFPNEGHWYIEVPHLGEQIRAVLRKFCTDLIARGETDRAPGVQIGLPDNPVVETSWQDIADGKLNEEDGGVVVPR